MTSWAEAGTAASVPTNNAAAVNILIFIKTS
jgi:hypothetical protein